MSIASERITLAISSCLLGERVRFDGAHKKDRLLLDVFSPHVRWVSICPEVEAGMGVPRDPVNLYGSTDGIRMRTATSGRDLTDEILQVAAVRAKQLQVEGVSGYIFKSRSPSCGVRGVAVDGIAEQERMGLFADSIHRLLPGLPIEDEERLEDRVFREAFVEACFAYRRLDSFFGKTRTPGQVVMFHSQSQLQLISHSAEAEADLRRVAETAGETGPDELMRTYSHKFMQTIRRPASREGHLAALQMCVEALEPLDREDMSELMGAMESFASGAAPLIVVLTLLMHHVNQRKDAYLHGQTYLAPDPREVLLRYHA